MEAKTISNRKTQPWITFLGDIACPHGLLPRIEGPGMDTDDFTVVNLEGSMIPASSGADGKTAASSKLFTLYNSENVLPTLKNWGTRVAALANNHILDTGALPSTTRKVLAEAGIAACGAGDDLNEAAQAATVSHESGELAFLAFGWSVIECEPAGISRPGVNPLDPAHVLESVARVRASAPDAKLVILMHWDYELERYPMPAQRQLAMALIDQGAAAVVGHHPHCVQGVEFYRDRPIVYSLGNWFLPAGDWFGKPLTWPQTARRQLAFRWQPDTGEAVCRWYDYDPDAHCIHFHHEEDARGGEHVRELTPFADMPQDDYVKWFARHRAKRAALPIYRDYRHTVRNRFYDRWVALRGCGVRWLGRLKLR